ncbi:MAG: phosphonate metabolism protein/1,5-bisphosphokinase (PRPP-forming) PhnN [Pseudomonadota bacterium]
MTGQTGTLFLVVGPSGVGKDTLIDRARLARPDIVFPKRVVTRAADAGGETIDAVLPEAFAAMRAAGAFALDWDAHGLCYGVPAAIHEDLAAGRDVLVNVSRAILVEARQRFRRIRVLMIVAEPDVLAARLAARGREDALEIAERLRRARLQVPEGPDLTVIDNSGPLEMAAQRFLGALQPVRA